VVVRDIEYSIAISGERSVKHQTWIFIVACYAGCIANVCAQVTSTSSGQAYPAKPVRMLFGYTAGGAGDVSARMLAQRMSEQLGQNVVVENRPGAGGSIADDAVAKAPPDGYTLLYAAGSTAILPALRANLPYNVERDLAPVSLVVITSFVLSVHPSVPARDTKALIALARQMPGKLKFGSPGMGSSAHFAGEVAHMMADVKMLHVPYRGAPEAATALVSDETDVGWPTVTGAVPFISLGKIRPLAVSSAARAALLPAVPTLNEAGVAGYERAGWNGVLAPAGISRDIIARLNAAIVKSVAQPETRDAFVKQGLEVRTTTPEEFAAFIKRELAQNATVVKFAGIKTE
jgi:tripartite-type tricarboxylate transporter receptor subunit TctC